MNFGPQHPAAHGVLRLILEMDGEIVERADPHIGLLHRGTEKLIEYKTYLQSIPYFDRLDYVSPMCQEHAFVLAIEKLLRSRPPPRGQYIRVMFSEITRILNHLLNITTYALDVGAITPSLWGFEERENLMEFYERVCGARLHANYFRPGGVALDLPAGLADDIWAYTERFPKFVDDLEDLLSREQDLQAAHGGYRHRQRAGSSGLGLHRSVLRASNVAWDLRKAQPYDVYDQMDFDIPVGLTGDCYARYLVRMEEMRQCNKHHAPVPGKNARRAGPGSGPQDRAAAPRRNEAVDGSPDPSLQALYRGLPRSRRRNLHGRRGAQGRVRGLSDLRRNQQAVSLQDPRSRLRPPPGLDFMSKGHMLADAVAIIGSMDVVFGEIDR